MVIHQHQIEFEQVPVNFRSFLHNKGAKNWISRSIQIIEIQHSCNLILVKRHHQSIDDDPFIKTIQGLRNVFSSFEEWVVGYPLVV